MVREIKHLFKMFTGFSRRSRNLLLNAGVLTYAEFSLGRFSIDGEGIDTKICFNNVCLLC